MDKTNKIIEEFAEKYINDEEIKTEKPIEIKDNENVEEDKQFKKQISSLKYKELNKEEKELDNDLDNVETLLQDIEEYEY